MPGGAASYHVAPPVWLLPEGAVEAPLPGEPEPDFGSGFGGVDAGLALATGLVVLVVRGTARVVVVRGNARSAVLDGVVGGTVDAVVVGDADASDAVADWLTSLSTARCPPSPAPAATEIDAAR